MKPVLKFLLSISNTKMVVLSNNGKKDCYVFQKESPVSVQKDFSKIADCITEYEK
ncbi:MAG: hypothetical protein J6S61_05705 [Elusimicrobiaceae bacterium]|nr:hypothetical protein [Elusimicrobiaceae bacterium]